MSLSYAGLHAEAFEEGCGCGLASQWPWKSLSVPLDEFEQAARGRFRDCQERVWSPLHASWVTHAGWEPCHTCTF